MTPAAPTAVSPTVTISPAPEEVAPAPATPVTETGSVSASPSVKNFTMKSWMDKDSAGKMAAHFSLPEIKVKKGDTVHLTITNTAGNHDFNLDEFKVHAETPVNKDTVVEFIADKAGTFEYYCSKYNHRQLGQRGNLIVE